MRGMRALQDVGLVGDVGLSNYSLARWRKAEAALGRPVLSNQVRYSLVDRRPERELIPYAQRHGRLVIAYSPLAQGFLTGRYSAANRPRNPVRRYSKLFRADSFARAGQLFETLAELGRSHDATPAQIALAWTIRSPNVIAIPGASSVAQVESNAAAADLELASGEIEALNHAAGSFIG
jgi:aryl-alcohol dehydrogenase-like predicted oxidoreductase